MDEHIERWMTLVVPPVLKRIEQLGYADQAAVIAASKASQPTVASFMGTGDIDRIPKRPRNGTLKQMGDTLKWAPGWFDDLLAGRPPREVDPSQPVSQPPDVARLHLQVVRLATDVQTLARLLREMGVAVELEGDRGHPTHPQSGQG